MCSIAKKIHYCWFGGNPLGEKELACIESWRKYLPDYEIIRWDESNFNVRCCEYVSEAYDAKKWAFVSDYARFKILYEYGGLYFDTDVEVIRPLNDIIKRGPFMGFETDFGSVTDSGTVAAGLGLLATPGLEIYKVILDSYQNAHFLKTDGGYDQTSVVYRVTNILREFGLKDKCGIQEIAGITIYPSEYFNPKSFVTGKITITNNTRCIHHFSMSWFTPEEKFQHAVNGWLISRGINEYMAGRISAVITTARFLHFGRIARHISRDRNE